MIVLSNDKKTIKISFNDGIYVSDSKKSYRVELPTVICDNKLDAEIIQQQINTFIVKLSNELLGVEKNEN